MSDVQRHLEVSRQKRLAATLDDLLLEHCDEVTPVSAHELLRIMRARLLPEEVKRELADLEELKREVIPFGIHVGCNYASTPRDYLTWLCDSSRIMYEKLNRYLELTK